MEGPKTTWVQSLIMLTLFAFFMAIAFHLFFQASKHIPFLSSVTPFLEDPYDAVGSFGIQIAVSIGLLNLIRIYLIIKSEAKERYLFVLKGNLFLAWTIIFTIVVDIIAIIKAGIHTPSNNSEIVLYSLMLILIIAGVIILLKSYGSKKYFTKQYQESAKNRNELDLLFKWKYLNQINPQIHPIRFSLLISITIGLLISLTQLIGERPPPNFKLAILVFFVFLTIESAGVFMGLLIFGKYLGILYFEKN